MDEQQRDEWRQADRLFQRLIDLSEPERHRMLADAEIPEPVRQKLQSLLDMSQQPNRLLDGEHLDLPWLDRAEDHSSTEQGAPQQGRRMGEWQLHELLGHGGMAAVYRGQRTGKGLHPAGCGQVARRGVGRATGAGALSP